MDALLATRNHAARCRPRRSNSAVMMPRTRVSLGEIGLSSSILGMSDNEEGLMGGAAERDAGGKHGSRPAAVPIGSR